MQRVGSASTAVTSYKFIESDDIGVIHDRRLMYVPSTSLEDEE